MKPVLRFTVCAVCAYEAVTLATGLGRPVSHIVRARRWAGVVILAGLACHFYLEDY